MIYLQAISLGRDTDRLTCNSVGDVRKLGKRYRFGLNFGLS